MPAQSSSLWQKLSAFLARKIVWLWPQETKEWGLAFEAELPEITTPLASARWVMGGAVLLAREGFRHFLKSLWRPVGTAAPSDSSAFDGNGGPAPRLPRVFAGLFLFASLAMLCLPEVRASLGSSVLFGQTKIHEYFHERKIQKLREKARANHDPQLIAFLSLALSYDNEHLALADEAIRRDPSLTWIDYAESYWNFADPDRSHFLSDERIARLQKFDPQNAAMWLLTAEVIRHPVEQAYWMKTLGSDSAWGSVPAWEQEITKNPAWLAAMDRAFEAPQLHDYLAQQTDLVRRVSRRYRISDPELTGYAVFASRLLGDRDFEAYCRFLMEQGNKEAANGNWSAATQDYEKVEQFAEKIQEGIESDWGRWWAAKIGTPAAKNLQKALEASGRPAEAQIASAKFASWDKANAEFQSHSRQNYVSGKKQRPWSRAERAGLVINLAVVLIAIVLPLAAVALLCVAIAPSYSRRIFGRFYRFVCLAADIAPIVLVLSFALLFFAYHPYAHPFESGTTQEQMLAAAGVAHTLPRKLGQFVFNVFYINRRYYFWVGLTSALSLITLFLLYRMALKKRRS